MTERAQRYLAAGAPKTIMHGEYEGTLVDIQPLVCGYFCGIYRFPGGDCVEGPMLHVAQLRRKESSHDKE